MALAETIRELSAHRGWRLQLIHSYLSALPSDYPGDKAIREAIERANAKITPVEKEPDAPQRVRSGTAAIVALVQQDAEGTHAWIGHVGDCRAYLLRAGRLTRLTQDQTAAESLLSRGLIAPEEVFHHPDASVLTRSLGAQPEVEIDLEKHQLAVGDTLLLCSDGLWRSVPEIEIQRMADGPSVEVSALNLLHLALELGGRDNISIEMARLIETRILPRKSEHSLLLKGILAFLVFMFIGLCVLAYLTFVAP